MRRIMGLLRGVPHPIKIPLLRHAWMCKPAALQLSPLALGDTCELFSACTEGISHGEKTSPLLLFYHHFSPVCNRDHAELPCGLERVMEWSGEMPKSVLLSERSRSLLGGRCSCQGWWHSHTGWEMDLNRIDCSQVDPLKPSGRLNCCFNQ